MQIKKIILKKLSKSIKRQYSKNRIFSSFHLRRINQQHSNKLIINL